MLITNQNMILSVFRPTRSNWEIERVVLSLNVYVRCIFWYKVTVRKGLPFFNFEGTRTELKIHDSCIISSFVLPPFWRAREANLWSTGRVSCDFRPIILDPENTCSLENVLQHSENLLNISNFWLIRINLIKSKGQPCNCNSDWWYHKDFQGFHIKILCSWDHYNDQRFRYTAEKQHKNISMSKMENVR